MSVASLAGPVPSLAGIFSSDLILQNELDWGMAPHDILALLIADIPWRQESITLFGKTHLQPRLLCWMGDPGCAYAYSGTRHEPELWHPLVRALRGKAEAMTGVRFNSVLLNYYRNGQDSMGYHADDEPELGERPTIASLSFGAQRIMHFRHRHDRSIATQKIVLTDGSLLIMRGDCQADWKHAISKTRKVIGPRVNLTFRHILC